MDFFEVKARRPKSSIIEIYPEFKVKRSRDLMVRGGAFYAVWNGDIGLWDQDEYTVKDLVDRELAEKKKQYEGMPDVDIQVKWMLDDSSGSWQRFRKYARNLPDNYKELDSKLTFSDTPVVQKDYVSRRLPYPLADGDYSAWDEIVGTLYLPDEREKIEWAIGAVVSGDSQSIQKFLVFYGDPGTGKGTILDIIRKLFNPYCITFDAGELTRSGNSFPMEQFRKNPLVAIQFDGDLSHIASNTKLNSLVSHEPMPMTEKYKSSYDFTPHCFLFLASNDPVQITNAKSGLIRRLIDVNPSMRLIETQRYFELTGQIDFELGAIAKHCLDVYEKLGKHRYKGYKPTSMISRTDPFYNFVDSYYLVFSQEDGVTLKNAYERYTDYCDRSGMKRKPMYWFKEELKSYFKNFEVQTRVDGQQVRSWYSGFDKSMFDILDVKRKGKADDRGDKGVAGREDSGQNAVHELLCERDQENVSKDTEDGPGGRKAESGDGGADRGLGSGRTGAGETGDIPDWLRLGLSVSLLDAMLASQPAQYANEEDKPVRKWAEVSTRLQDLSTDRVHFVRVPEHHIVIDFDLKDEHGNKSLEKCLREAAKWKPTYAEASKGGGGLHLHYIYDGDPNELESLYAPGIEIKVFRGRSSLRRRVSKCNDIPVAHLASGLPKKEAKKSINFDSVKSEKGLRRLIERNLNKEIHPGTKPSIDFIEKILDDAYEQGLHYDVSDMRPDIMDFAIHSSHNAEYCLTRVAKMKFMSADISDAVIAVGDERIVFFDIEVFPNLVLVNWKFAGDDVCERMINPKPVDIEMLMKYRLIGFNCRRYDNHILYAIYLGKTTEEIYDISQGIVSGSKNCMFGEAYNISYTDVYDFAAKKQSLKKWEIELGIHHQELGLPWDQPVPEEKWLQVAEYCDNDVFATEAVFNHLQADWTARQILADIAGMTVNDTTNSLTTRIIFGKDRQPQGQFNYRNMGDIPIDAEYRLTLEGEELDTAHTVFTADGKPIFPGYSFDRGKSIYRGEEVGEGGYVYAEPGIHTNVALLDIASMHPSSIVAEQLFGEEYTKRFQDILQTRILIKHKDYENASKLFDGKLSHYLADPAQAKALAGALKIAINSVYGLTSAKFDNPFRDVRNKDNIVAKRGALFMVNLKHEVQSRGYTVAHIKTDSIKIPNASPEIIQFVMDYGKMYGYNFEHEATYERMCLVNDAVYIARYSGDERNEHPGEWTATGTQFQVPFVFKSLFSREPIRFADLCETKSCTTALYLDMNEGLVDVGTQEKEFDKLASAHRKLCKEWTQGIDEGTLSEQDETYTAKSDSMLARMKELSLDIQKGHDYVFIGKVGLFAPVRAGCGGGLLMREKEGKYYAVGGTTGYRWLEAETIHDHLENLVDMRYFQNLADEAVETISEYGDFYDFVDVGPCSNLGLPWDHEPSCGEHSYENCLDCPHWRVKLDAENFEEVYQCDKM